MASDTDSARNEDADLVLTWSGRWTLAHRILAVNVLTLVAGRARDPLSRRLPQPAREGTRPARLQPKPSMAAIALQSVPPEARETLLRRLVASRTTAEFGSTAQTARSSCDSWRQTGPDLSAARPDHPEVEQGRRPRARPRLQCPGRRGKPVEDFVEPAVDRASAWPEVIDVAAIGQTRNGDPPGARPDTGLLRRGAGRRRQRRCWSPTMTATSPGPCASSAGSLVIALGVVAMLSVLLSLFLARTIVRPLRRIALAAHRVRLGRAREVKVPRLPSRTRRDRPARARRSAT